MRVFLWGYGEASILNEVIRLDIVDAPHRDTVFNVLMFLKRAAEWPTAGSSACLAEVILQSADTPPQGIGDGVAEHVNEDGLKEGVELGEGLPALGPQGVRRIQNPCNPSLLGERREGDF